MSRYVEERTGKTEDEEEEEEEESTEHTETEENSNTDYFQEVMLECMERFTCRGFINNVQIPEEVGFDFCFNPRNQNPRKWNRKRFNCNVL